MDRVSEIDQQRSNGVDDCLPHLRALLQQVHQPENGEVRTAIEIEPECVCDEEGNDAATETLGGGEKHERLFSSGGGERLELVQDNLLVDVVEGRPTGEREELIDGKLRVFRHGEMDSCRDGAEVPIVSLLDQRNEAIIDLVHPALFWVARTDVAQTAQGRVRAQIGTAFRAG